MHLITHRSLSFTRSDDYSQVTREIFSESDSPSSRIKPISRGSYDRLEEFYASVRTDCWPRGLRKEGPRKRHTTERDYIPGFRICRAYREIFPARASRSSLGDFYIHRGMCRPSKTIFQITHRPYYDLAHAAPSYGLHYACIYPRTAGTYVYYTQANSISFFPISLRSYVSVGVLQ